MTEEGNSTKIGHYIFGSSLGGHLDPQFWKLLTARGEEFPGLIINEKLFARIRGMVPWNP